MISQLNISDVCLPNTAQIMQVSNQIGFLINRHNSFGFAITFLHAGFTHILFNMWGLWIWGRYAEVLYGKIRYGIIYLFSGLMGSILSFWLSPAVSIGASGALFGVLGALCYIGIGDRQMFKRLLGRSG